MCLSILCFLLQVLSICESPCGEVSFENTSSVVQTVAVISSTGSMVSSFTMAGGATEVKTLQSGKYVFSVWPAKENYSLLVEGCDSSAPDEPVLPQSDFLFSVSPSQKVRFSPGNLQYQASTGTWRFAEHQYDYVGDATSGNVSEGGNPCDNSQTSASYSGWIDLFAWGTSGYNGKQPYMNSGNYNDYGDGSNDIAATNYDWGVYAAISNGNGYQWRTLTTQEWEYLFKTRSKSLYGHATVCGVKGIVLLPDNWQLPDGMTFISSPANYYERNVYDAEQWLQMEEHGAVFLPAAGMRRTDNVVLSPDEIGYYWTSSCYGVYGAMNIYFTYFSVNAGNTGWLDSNKTFRYEASSVRLVR